MFPLFLSSDIDDFVLKVAGRNSYIQGYNELLQFSQVVKALSKRQDVELALVNKLDTSLDLPRQIPDVSTHAWTVHMHISDCL